MGRRPISKTEQLMKQLDAEDRKRVRKFAERLADGGQGAGSTPESLVEGQSLPSYTAAADRDAYEKKKEMREHHERVW